MRAGGRIWILVGMLGAIGAGVTFAHAQQIWAGGFGGRTPPRFPTEQAELVRSYGLLEDRMDLVTDAAEFERKLDARLGA